MRIMKLSALSAGVVSLIAATTLQSVNLAADEQPVDRSASGASKSEASSGQTATRQSAEDRDYYTRRAQELLENDAAEDSEPHPLAENYPDQFVVVCTAGCRNRTVQIVDFEPRPKGKVEEIGVMIPTAAPEQPAQEDNVVRCLGGCGSNESYRAVSSANSDWQSHAAPEKTESESGRWLKQ